MITIVIPTYNQGKYIADTIDSILKQTYKDFQLIIVDDGSTDNTQEILNRYNDPRIKKFYKQNGGTGSALNLGFQYSNRKYETWFASDNVMYPTALERMFNFIESKQVDFVYANCDIGIWENGREIKRKNLKEEVGDQRWNPDRVYERFYLGIMWLWKKSLRIKAGEKYIEKPCEDYEMICRMIEAKGKFEFLDEDLGWFRRHKENMSHKVRGTEYVENLVKEMVKRRDELKKNEFDLEKHFTDIYNKNVWGGKLSKSGKGSDLDQTSTIISELSSIIENYDINSIIDLGCGDLNWIQYVLSKTRVKYTGVDIVRDMIENNRKVFPNFHFEYNNIIDYNILKVDLVFCRDVLVHLSYDEINKIIDNVIKSGSKYFMTTCFFKNRKKIDVHETPIRWRTLNLLEEPFSFPAPELVLNEHCTQADRWDTYEDKSLAMWKVEDLKKMRDKKSEPEIILNDLKKKQKNRTKKKWVANIPKKIHFYWGNEHFPFLKYLTIKSFRKYNPDWEIFFHYPKFISLSLPWKSHEHKYKMVKINDENDNDYYDELKKIDGIQFKKIDFEVKYGIKNELPEVFKSDFLRYELLSTVGGIWSDIDILWFRPLMEAHFNEENVDTIISLHGYHSIGFLGSCEKNEYYKVVFNRIKKLIENVDFSNYQSLGATFLNRYFGNLSALKRQFSNLHIVSILENFVYSYYPLNKLNDLYMPGGKDYRTDESIGIHWYAGAEISGKFSSNINMKNYIEFENTVIGKIIKDVMK